MSEIITYRKRAVELVEWACDNGRAEISSKNYRVVDSDAKARRLGISLRELSIKEKWKHKHSSCAILAHWMLEQLFLEHAIRLPWVGREEQKVNVLTRLHAKPAPSVAYKSGTELQGGDVGIIWRTGYDAHVLVVINHDLETGEVCTAEYGQPHGELKTRKLIGRKMGRKTLHRVLPLANVLAQYNEWDS